MVTIRTLEDTPIEELLDVFNLSFSDYVVPLFLTEEQLEAKINNESVRLDFSVGAFENDKLIAFILHGIDYINNIGIAYNAGTGVIPAKRGKKLTTKMYEYIVPILSKNSIDKILLEVITTNQPAIHTYQIFGFKTVRHLNCFKGSISISNTKNHFEIRELKNYDWQKFCSFWDIEPSWQNSIKAVEKLRSSNLSIGLYDNGKLIGYVIFNPKSKRINQISVDRNYRNRGVGKKLIEYIATNYGKEVLVINVDQKSQETLKFMTNIGMNIFVMQYEMELKLKNKNFC